MRQAALLGLSTTALGSLLSACGAGSGASERGASGTHAPSGSGKSKPAAGSSGTKTLEFVTFYTGGDGVVMQDIVNRYNRTHSGFKVKFSAPAHDVDYVTKIRTSAVAGTAPAVVALHNLEIPPLAQFLYPVEPAALGIKRSDYIEVAWKLPMYEGKLLGLTMSIGPFALFYNKAHFEQAGLDPERPPTNRDEFIEAARALTRKGRYGVSRESGYFMPWQTYSWQAGGGMISHEGGKTRALFDTPAAIEAAQFEQDLVHKYECELPHEFSGNGNPLTANKVSMWPAGPWNLREIIRQNEQNGTHFGWTTMPRFFEKQQAVISTSHIYCLMKKSPEDPRAKELGGKFVVWLLETGSLEWAQSQVPTNVRVHHEMKRSKSPVVRGIEKVWVPEASYAHFPPAVPNWSQAFTVLDDAMQKIAYQGADVRSTMTQVEAQANEILNRP